MYKRDEIRELIEEKNPLYRKYFTNIPEKPTNKNIIK